MNIPILEMSGYEADDLIGTLSKQAEQVGFEVYMATPDKDYGQLVSEHVFMYRPRHTGGFEKMNRRQFIGGMFALAGAAAWAKAGRGAPRLKVGVLSDIHISTPDMFNSQDAIDMFAKTLEFFKQENVDAVLIAGDLTNDGMVKELKAVADTWAKVFGGIDRGPVRVFTTGNHEVVSFNQAKRKKDFSNPRYSEGFALDMRKNWMEVFGEEWSPFFIKKVKGYSFVGAHWAEWNDEKALRGFMDANRDALSGKPFFFVQHAHPQNSCYGTWTWHQQDGGQTHKVLPIIRTRLRFPDTPIIRSRTSAASGRARSRHSARGRSGGFHFLQGVRTGRSTKGSRGAWAISAGVLKAW